MSVSRTILRALALPLFLALALSPAEAYSVLSHEEVVDMAWHDTIVPMLRARFPGISPDQIREAHSYAYGGSVIQDIGYYPFGSHYFSDLLHYVRPDAFVETLIRDSVTPDDYAFALGALIERFFAHPVPRTGSPPTKKQARREAALATQIKLDLATLEASRPIQP